METQNHTSCKRNYTLLFFLHFRGTNHIAGSRLSIGKAGVYSKEQDKKKCFLKTNFMFDKFFSIDSWLTRNRTTFQFCIFILRTSDIISLFIQALLLRNNEHLKVD